MAETITIKGLQNRAARFLKCHTFGELARALRKEPLKLIGLAAAPMYREFYIPKKNGGRRLIENPEPQLKKVQRRLNDFLQAVYFFHRTPPAYGFLTNPTDDPAPRHILTNARAHIGAAWLLNVDLKDFFHTVSQERVQELFEAPIFDFNEEVAKALAGICCYKERLPMGAPTSPIISNLVCIPLDQDLGALAESRAWRFTRYADDLSFSSPTEITQAHIPEIDQWVQAYNYRINPEKVKLYGPERKDKEVTGLLVGDTEVGLPEDFLQMLRDAIRQLDLVVDAKFSMPSGMAQRTFWLEELESQVKGKLEFARQILGEDDELYLDLESEFDKAMTPPEYYGPLNWLDFGYSYFK